MLLSAANAAEQRFDRLRFEAKRRLGLLDPFEILPYRGYATRRELFLKGRVLEERGITRSGQYATLWDNLRNMARRFASDEVPGAHVRASFKGHEVRPAPTRRVSSMFGSSWPDRSLTPQAGIRSNWSCSTHRRPVEGPCVPRDRCSCRRTRSSPS